MKFKIRKTWIVIAAIILLALAYYGTKSFLKALLTDTLWKKLAQGKFCRKFLKQAV